MVKDQENLSKVINNRGGFLRRIFGVFSIIFESKTATVGLAIVLFWVFVSVFVTYAIHSD